MYSLYYDKTGNEISNIGRIIKYCDGENAEIIDEDETHILIKFTDGCKFCVSKYRYFEK